MYSSLQLEALLAVCDAGSFERAARELHVTTSALSQRIAGLERTAGCVLVRRTRPVTPTEPGEVLLGLARSTVLLHAEAAGRLQGGPQPVPRLSLAVNADSLATWFDPVVAEVAAQGRWLLDLRVDDESITDRLLADGRVVAAVSTAAATAPGCRVEPLGVLRYVPVASPALLQRRGCDDPARLPMVRFDGRDELQHAHLRALGAEDVPPAHLVPANREFLRAIMHGLGWGMVPLPQAQPHLQEGALVRLGDRHLDVTLHWHRRRLASDHLDALTALVRDAAARGLCPAATGAGAGR